MKRKEFSIIRAWKNIFRHQKKRDPQHLCESLESRRYLNAIAAPSELSVSHVTGNSADLSWVDNTSNETGFELWQETDGAFALLTTVAPGTTNYQLTELGDSNRYAFRVRTIAGTEHSDFSRSVEFVTQGVWSVAQDNLPPDNQADLVIDGVTADEEAVWGTELRVNSDHDEQNHDSHGSLVSDNQSDALVGERIVANDNELHNAWLFIRQSDNAVGRWKLTFPSRIKLWEQSGDNWIPIISGQTSAALQGENVISLKIEGISPSLAYWDGTITADWIPATGSASSDTASVVVLPLVPASPSDIVARINDQNLVDIFWSSTPELDVGGFVVYRSVDGGPFTAIGSARDSEVFTDTDPQAGLLTYRITSANSVGTESSPAEVHITRDADVTSPEPVTNLSAVPTKKGVILNWTPSASPDAGRADVYRKFTFDKKFEYVETMYRGESQFFDDSGIGAGLIKYRIITYDTSGNNSAAAINVVSSVPDHTAPPAPTNVSYARNKAGRYVVTWDQEIVPDLAGYVVSKSNEISPDGYYDYAVVYSGTTYTDESDTSSETAYYRISAVDDMGNRSAWIGNDVTPPPAVTGVTASADVAGVTISWAGVSSSDLAGYNIFVGDTQDDNYAYYIGNTDAGTTSFHTDSVVPGYRAYYLVRAVDTSGNFAAPGVADAIRPLEEPTGLTASLASSEEVNLHWNSVWASDTHFDVFRGTSATFTCSPETRIATGLTTEKFIDTSLGKWTTYYYRIIVHASDIDSPPSAAVAVTNSNSGAVPTNLDLVFTEDYEYESARGVTWDESVLNAQGFYIEHFNYQTSKWDRLGTARPHDTHFYINNINLALAAKYRVYGFNAFGTGTPVETSVEGMPTPITPHSESAAASASLLNLLFAHDRTIAHARKPILDDPDKNNDERDFSLFNSHPTKHDWLADNLLWLTGYVGVVQGGDL